MAAAHQLQNTWVLWEHKNASDGDWSNSMKEVCEFSSVEEFWKNFAFIPRPSELFNDGSNTKREVNGRVVEAFSLFKKGIKPEWEDAANRSGAELVARKFFAPETLDLYWEHLVLGLIGETMDDGDEICGGRIVDKSKRGARPMFKLELWLRSNSAEVGDRMRVRLLDCLVDGDSSKHNRSLPDFGFKTH